MHKVTLHNRTATALTTCLLFTHFSLHSVQDKCAISITPLWQELEHKNERIEQLGGKPILVAQITFKKRLQQPMYLDSLQLQWHGPTMQSLAGSLYMKSFDKDFVPLERHLVCDGIWHKAEQKLILNFGSRQTLSAVNTFYVVFRLSPEQQTAVKNGSFSLLPHSLPDAFRPCASSATLTLL